MNPSSTCPDSGTRGRPVKSVTVRSLVVPSRRDEVEPRTWRFCDAAGCDVVYYADDGVRITRRDVIVRVGIKERSAPRQICYCFGHAFEDIAVEPATAPSAILSSIRERCLRGLARCEETNPSGKCCLGDVQRAVHAARATYAGASAPDRATVAASPSGDACCETAAATPASVASRPRRRGLLVISAALGTAALSSACCWLPLLLLAVGASVAGVAAILETYRPLLLTLTGVLLAGGFYLAYFRKPACAPDGSCVAPDAKAEHITRISLWTAAVAVAAFAMFPMYVEILFHRAGNGATGTQSASAADDQRRVFTVTGMTCAGCAGLLEHELDQVDGVASSTANYTDRSVVVLLERAAAATDVELLQAIRRIGFDGHVEGGPARQDAR